ncbi:unnamed protein product [Sphagnum balticum]
MAFCLMGQRVSDLGISKLILRALNMWTLQQENFRKTYESFPYGSRIILENIATSPHAVRVLPVKSTNAERHLLSPETLKEMWNLPDAVWPECIKLEELCLVAQIHDTISQVQIHSKHPSKHFIFKSATTDPKYLYHELKNLLRLPRHKSIMQPPLYLVTISNRYKPGHVKLCGMIFPYFPMGSLESILSSRKSDGPMAPQELNDKLRWCSQITSALININQSPVKFYSELKPDNILMTKSDDGVESVILIDFEQLGNWMDFSPPEVFYIEYLAHLVKAELVPDEEKQHYLQMALEQGVHLSPKESTYSNPLHGYYEPWVSFDDAETEAAEDLSIGADIVQRGSRVYPGGRTGTDNEPEATELETRHFVKNMWRAKLGQMEQFFEARKRWRNNAPVGDDIQLLGATLRPNLREVLQELIEISTML